MLSLLLAHGRKLNMYDLQVNRLLVDRNPSTLHAVYASLHPSQFQCLPHTVDFASSQ